MTKTVIAAIPTIIFSLFSYCQSLPDYQIGYTIQDSTVSSPEEVRWADVVLDQKREFDAGQQGWVIITFSADRDQNLSVLHYKERTQFWIEDLKSDTLVELNFAEGFTDHPNLYDPTKYLSRRPFADHGHLSYINHYLFPLRLNAGDSIRVWSRPFINKYGSNDWRTVHVIPYEELVDADNFNLIKFSIFCGGTLMLLAFTLFLSTRGVLERGILYALLCVYNFVFVFGSYPFGDDLAMWFEEYLFPHYFILSQIFALHYYFVSRFFGIRHWAINVVLGIMVLGFVVLVAVYHITDDINLSHDVLSFLNSATMRPAFPFFFLMAWLGRKKKLKPGSWYVASGVVVSNLAGIATQMLHGDAWFSLWFGGYDYLITGFFLEQILIAFGILKLMESQIKEKYRLEASLGLEREKVDKLARETVQLKIDKSEQEKAVIEAINTLKSIEEGTESGRSKKVYNTIQLLNRSSNDSNLYDSVKLLIEEKEPELRKYLDVNHSNLTQSENRLVEFYYLRLSNKEVANLLNISVNSLYVIKNRLKKKLGLPKEQSVEDYIQNLANTKFNQSEVLD